MLSVENLEVYYGESRCLTDVTLEVPVGKVVCLMGRNGVGKTTLLKAIMGVLKCRRGRVLFREAAGPPAEEITHRPSHERARAGIGYVPQGRGIFPYLTVQENLLMGLEALRRGKSDSFDEMYGLFPVLKQMRGRVAGTLSGGQQQQLAIARALASRPRLLLLDEPTEGIQPSITQEIEQVILNLGRQGRMSILLVEQFLDFAMGVADRYYIMETGTMVAHGAIADLDPTAAREYLAV